MRARSGPFEPGVAGTRTVSRKQASRRSGSMCHLYVGDKVGVWLANQHICFNRPRLGRDESRRLEAGGRPTSLTWRWRGVLVGEWAEDAGRAAAFYMVCHAHSILLRLPPTSRLERKRFALPSASHTRRTCA